MKKEVFFIAEIGVNHNGSVDLAKELIDQALEAGANAVKFQTFSAALLTTPYAKKADYQKHGDADIESQRSMLEKLELPLKDHFYLKDYCDKFGIEFISTPFDVHKVNFLAKELGVKRLKIGSADIVNSPLLYCAAQTKLPVIISTGMSTLDEVIEAVALFAFEENNTGRIPRSRSEFLPYCDATLWSEQLKKRITLLHCVSLYPTPEELVNLHSIGFLRDSTGLEVGFSDHTQGTAISLAAVALGATVIEKHFTLSKTLPGPDHAASLEPHELKELVHNIRLIEKALGEPKKIPAISEHSVSEVVRGSLVAADNIKKNESLNFKNITVKRPGIGISPHFYWNAIHQWKAERDYIQDELIEI